MKKGAATWPENTGCDQARNRDGTFRKGVSGNASGRPRGSFNHATRIAQDLIDGEAEALMRNLIDKAIRGDVVALRLCVDRILPPKRSQPLAIKIERLENIHDVHRAFGQIVGAMNEGWVGTSELSATISLLSEFVKVCDIMDFEKRLATVESILCDATNAK